MSSSSDRLDQMLKQYLTSSSQYLDIRELTQLLSDVTHDEKVVILKRHHTLYEAALLGRTEIITTILSSVPQHQRLDVLLVREWTPLHHAAYSGQSDCVVTTLTHLTPEQQLKIMPERWYGDTPADWASLGGHEKTERLLRDYKLRAEKQTGRPTGFLDRLIHYIRGPNNSLQRITEHRNIKDRLSQMLKQYLPSSSQYPDIRKLTQLLCDVTHDEKVRILKSRGTLYTAAWCGHIEIITTILSSVQHHQRLDVLLVREWTPLHWAAHWSKSDSVETILTHLTPGQQLEILSVRGKDGRTPADWASLHGEKETERLLRDYKLRAEKRISDAKYKALIFYTKEGREDGAMEEATLLESSLNKVIGHVITQEWSTVTELEDNLHTNVTGLSADCSLLFISVMSHGRMGALCGSDGLLLPVNDLIDQITRVIPANLPLVLLIQACQGFDIDSNSGGDTDAASLPTDAERASADGCMHIDLVRPNTVLLMATATGGSALRGAYIKALAAEISKADDKKDIHEMHLSAVKEMRNNNGDYLDDIKQVPNYRDTLDGRIVLSLIN